jgi:hypothetical protein
MRMRENPQAAGHGSYMDSEPMMVL